jgi:uncharacterized protein YcbK (DUF882 family)
MSDQITKNFHISEFRCKCGNCVMPQAVKVNIVHLVKHYLQPLRDAVGAPIRISSGYRCRDYNSAIGGAKYSQHMYGNASDIKIDGMTAAEVHAKILELWPLVPGLGSYPTFTHIDNRNLDSRGGRPARW